jgi:hypothetical protein
VEIRQRAQAKLFRQFYCANVNWGPVLDPSQPASSASQGSLSNLISMLYLGSPQLAQMFGPRKLSSPTERIDSNEILQNGISA